MQEQRAELEELRAMAERITPNYSSVPGGGSDSTSKQERAVMAITDMQERINEMVMEQCRALDEAYNLIDLLDDELLKLVMLKRYIGHKQWEEIAVDLSYSWPHIHRLHSKALNAILKKMR